MSSGEMEIGRHPDSATLMMPLPRGRGLKISALEPGVLRHAVERNERYEDRGLLHVCLVFRVIGICLVLSELESSGSFFQGG